MDFSALILDSEGRESQILIEIQKAKLPGDISRFRNYLGEQYKKPKDSLSHDDDQGSIKEKVHLPIFSIYLLNFNLSTELPALLRIQRDYKNAVTDESLGRDCHDEFVESLTHDSFIVQIPKLSPKPTERLERTFALFNQMLTRKGDRHRIYLEDGTPLQDDVLIQKMSRVLTKAVAESSVAEQMEHEDILQEDIERSVKTLEKEISDLKKQHEETQLQKEEAIVKEREERRQKEEERRQKEEAIAKEQEERRQKEKERRQKEEAIVKEQEALNKLKSAYQSMLDSGMEANQALNILGLKQAP
jgi:flagellar biosynthesis GTPase FlhF